MTLGVDDMREAIAKGYLGEKLIAPKSFKVTEAMEEGILIVSESKGKDPSDWVREVIAEALVKADYEYERSRKARERRSNRWNSLAYQVEGQLDLPAEEKVKPSCANN